MRLATGGKAETKMKPSARLFLMLFFLGLFAFPAAGIAQQHITTIEPRNVPAEQLARIIKPQLSPGSTVTTYQNTLILNVTDDELTSIHQILARIDTRGRQLLISIRKTGDNSLSQQQGQVTIQRQQDPTIRIGRNGISPSSSQTATTVTISRQGTVLSGASDQSIRATEGIPVLISTGNTMLLNNPGNHNDHDQEWVSANNGFYATAWINGNSVTVKIEQQDNRFVNSTTISGQQLQTQVNGQIGQWIALGTIHERNNSISKQINSAERNISQSAQAIFLKIEPLD